MYSKWNGTYKGRGDKAEKYPYEGIFERDTNLFNRYMPTNSENYSLLPKSSNPRSAASNSRENLNGYGLASVQPVPEPSVETEVNAGINPKNVNKVPLNITAPVANGVTLPDSVKFSPISPTKVEIETPNINIREVTLSPLWNGDHPAGTQYVYDNSERHIKPGFTYDLNAHYGGRINGYNKVKTFSADEVLKTSQGIDYRTIPNYVAQYGTSRLGLRNYTYGAIFEFMTGKYTLEGLTLEVDEVKDSEGNVIKGTRAISTDHYTAIEVHNKSNIKLSADTAVGFATDNDVAAPNNVNNLRQMINEKEGLIYATGKRNVAFILVKEQNNPTATHKHVNNGKIIMDGEEAYAFAFSETTGVMPNRFIS